MDNEIYYLLKDTNNKCIYNIDSSKLYTSDSQECVKLYSLAEAINLFNANKHMNLSIVPVSNLISYRQLFSLIQEYNNSIANSDKNDSHDSFESVLSRIFKNSLDISLIKFDGKVLISSLSSDAYCRICIEYKLYKTFGCDLSCYSRIDEKLNEMDLLFNDKHEESMSQLNLYSPIDKLRDFWKTL